MEPTLVQKLRDIFNTIEGWAVLIALIWLGLAKSLGWPVSFDTGAGVISPAGLLTVAAPVVLAKLGWTRPFQSVKAGDVADKAAESPAKATVSLLIPILFALAIAVLFVGRADATPSPLSIDRLSGGVTAQAAIYSNGIQSGNPSPLAAFAPKAWLSYGILDEVSGHASFQLGVGAMRVNELHGGGAVRLLKEDPVRVSVGVDAVRYSGPDAGKLGLKDVVEYSLRFSKVLKRSSGAPRLGIQYQPAYIPANRNFCHRLGVNWTLFGGKAVIQ